ncbi:hypothetical protein [Pseudomonas mosselii]|uniref:hypothetical protein n=1 Tax=Pseudomonas mosselii TaxID=78327 RepID=UPI0021616283|nr:hypothetical protein [Pseudomonas mosselii]UVN46257.1 hypothetical protein NW905_09760 [Pseudomonas mosselii]
MTNELRVTLVRKACAAASTTKRPKTADEISRELSNRARKILAGEVLESNAKHLNSY